MIIDFRSKNGGGSGSGGTTNYNELENKPSLNGTTLQGNVTMPIPSKTSDLTNDSDFVNSTALDNEKTRAEQAEEVLDGKIVANTEAIQNKADKSTTYTKDEVDAALSNKADASDITDIDSKLQSKADSSDVNAIAESLSTTQEIVAQKANIGDSYTKAESDAKYLTEHQDISGKQDVIADLETIREGAALGATAIQEHQSLAEYAKTADMAAIYQPKGDYITEETDPVYTADKPNIALKSEIPSLDGYATEQWVESKNYITGYTESDPIWESEKSNYYTKTESDSKFLTEHQDISGKQDVIADLETIREGAALGATAIQEHQSLAEYAKTADMAAIYQPKGDYITEETDPVYTADKPNIALKSEIPSLDGYATEQWVENKNYITGYTETDPVWESDKGNYYTKSQVDSKIADVEMYKFPNVTLFGEPSINGGQLSNFSSTNYAQFPFLVDLRKPFEINFCVTPIDWDREQENIIDSDFGLAIAIRNNVFVVAMSSNGTSWNLGEHTGTWWATPNMTNYCKFSWDGSQYKLEVSNNPSEWGYSTDIVIDSTESLYPKTIVIGKGVDNTHIFTGSINLNYCNLSIDGNIVWNGMDDAGLATRLATDMSNIDAEGVNKVKEIAKSEIPSLDGYATEQWVNDKNYITGYTESDPIWESEKSNYYTKAESDALLDNKANTNLDNISDEGKENLKNMFKGNMHTIEFSNTGYHTITSDEAARKWFINYDAEVFHIWGDFMFSITQTGTNWDIYHNEYGKPEGTVTFKCTGSTQGIEIYDKATETKISTDADLDLTVDENSFYIKFLDRLYDLKTDYYDYALGLFYNGAAPLLDVYTKSEIKANYYDRNEIARDYASQYYVNNTFEKRNDVESDVNHYIDTYNFKTINDESITTSGNLSLVQTSYLEDTNNYAELHFFDENDNETTLLLLKKN